MAGAYSSAYSSAYDVNGGPIPPVPPVDGGGGVGVTRGHYQGLKPTWASKIYDLIERLTSPHRRYKQRLAAAIELLETPNVEQIIAREKIVRHVSELYTEDPEEFEKHWAKLGGPLALKSE